MNKLAKNSHEVWAAERVDQGWTYGPSRDDARRLHPLLVPWSRLDAEAKQYVAWLSQALHQWGTELTLVLVVVTPCRYDLQSATEAVKVALALGYHVRTPCCGASASPLPAAAHTVPLPSPRACRSCKRVTHPRLLTGRLRPERRTKRRMGCTWATGACLPVALSVCARGRVMHVTHPCARPCSRHGLSRFTGRRMCRNPSTRTGWTSVRSS